MNIPLDAGTYYLRVLPATTDVTDSPNPGDNYWLITALRFDEPISDPPDYDGDGDVDADDLLVWETAYGNEATGDTDSDGDTNGADFLAWQRQFALPASQTLLASVPEPAGAVLLVTGLMLLCNRTSDRH